jgi:hypothetical protein
LRTLGFHAHGFQKGPDRRKGKDIDIALTTDMLGNAFNYNYDVAVLISGAARASRRPNKPRMTRTQAAIAARALLRAGLELHDIAAYLRAHPRAVCQCLSLRSLRIASKVCEAYMQGSTSDKSQEEATAPF